MKKSSKSVRTKKQARSYRANIKKLRDAGLIGRVDLRKKPSRAGLKAIEKYQDVLKGRAVVVETTGKRAKALSKQYKTKGRRVVVPREKGERVAVDKKTGEIVAKKRVGKRTRTRRIVTRDEALAAPTRRGYKRVYGIYFASVGWQKFDDVNELKNFMQGYEPPKGTFKNIADYVVMVDIPVSHEDDDDLIDDRLETRLEKKLGHAPQRRGRR